MPNPFSIKVISPNDPFCNRLQEMKDLSRHAKNKANVVLYSPRRYGKTSLVKRVQKEIKAQGILTVFVDLFGLTSTEDIAARIATSIYKMLHAEETLFKKSLKIFKSFRPVMRPSGDGLSISVETIPKNIFGLELLEKVMEDIGEFLSSTKRNVNIVLDEFQEITELKDKSIEGVLRKYIQEHAASYFFVGSRRRILLDIFTKKSRPFYNSAFLYKLEALPENELIEFIHTLFNDSGKKCSQEIARKITNKVSRHPYYTQKLAYLVFEGSKIKISEAHLKSAFQNLIDEETVVFESIIQGLAPKQIALLKALANEPSSKILSMEYLKRNNLTSIGGVQAALTKLTSLDLIERGQDKIWTVVDPIFKDWLTLL